MATIYSIYGNEVADKQYRESVDSTQTAIDEKTLSQIAIADTTLSVSQEGADTLVSTDLTNKFTTAMLQDGSVTAVKLADDVTGDEIPISSTDTTAISTALTTLDDKVDSLAASTATLAADNWAIIAELCDGGNASSAFSIGEQIGENWTDVRASTSTTYEDAPLNVVHFSDTEEDEDGNTVKGMFLQWAYTPSVELAFDAEEALYDVGEDGLTAGTYYFKFTGAYSSWKAAACNDRYYQFTTTADYSEGAQIVLGGTYDTSDFTTVGANVYGSNTSYTSLEALTLTEVTEDTATGTYLGATDGTGDLNHMQRILGGYNRYKNSAIRQWLNSSAGVGEWWTSQNKWDRAPSNLNTYSGFLAGYSEDVTNAMKAVKIQVAANTVTDGGATDVMYDKVFLPSLEQMYITPQVSGAEGDAWEYYKQLAADNGNTTPYKQYSKHEELISYNIADKTTAVYVCLRSAYRGDACLAWTVYASGNINNGHAYSTLRVRPACFI